METNYENKILFGDALEVLKQLPDCIVQTCVTSPPYWGLRDYGHEGQLGLEETPEKYIDKLTAILGEVNRVLKDDGTLWLNLGDSYNGSGGAGGDYNEGGLKEGQPKYKGRNISSLKPKDLCMIPARVAIALQANGWYLRSDIIWHKPNSMPESVKDRPTKSHEHIFLLSKSKKYYYDWKAIGEEFESNKNDLNKIRNKGAENYGKNGYKNGKPLMSEGKRNWYDKGKKNKRDVWSVNTQPFPESHFAVYPPKLIEPCIKAGSKEGDLILDPFIGSGTTAEVALKLQRKYLGIDLQEDYEELQNKRLDPLRNDLFTSKAFAQ